MTMKEERLWDTPIYSFRGKAQIGTQKLAIMLGLLLLCWLMSASCFGYDLYVDCSANPNVADGSFDHPYIQIQQAVDHALNNTLPENNTPPYPTVQINIFDGDYYENVVLYYRNSLHITDITLTNVQDEDEVDCHIIGTNSQLPVIYATGYSTSRLKLFGLRITSNNSSIYRRGVKIGNGVFNDGYFGDFEMDECVNDYYGIAVDAELASISSLKVVNSMFTNRYDQGRGVNSWLQNYSSAEAIVEGCHFINSIQSNASRSINLQGNSYGFVNIANNNMERSEIALAHVGSTEQDGTNTRIQDNTLTNSKITICETPVVVLNNKFAFSGDLSPDQHALYLANASSSVAYAKVINNTFFNCPIAIYLALLNIDLRWCVSASIEGNSFIDCQRIVKLQTHTGNEFYNTITMFRNNLSTRSSERVFDICDFNELPLTLQGDRRIPISYSHFGCQLNNSSSMIIGTNVSYGDPGISINETGDSYSLLWNETIRSPAILTGYDEELVSNQSNHRPDIGVSQFTEFPHENRTYTFPAGNERNGIKWMSFPTIDRICGENDMAMNFFADILNPMITENITWKVGNGNPMDFHYSQQNGWVGSDHLINPEIGYKISMNPSLAESVSITTPGILPNVNQPMQLKAWTDQKSSGENPDNENWLGYYGAGTVHPYDAFASILDNLWYIQAQNWTLARWSAVPGSPWIGISYPGSKPPTLKYGDMVIVKCFNDASFTWNEEAPPRDEFIKEKPSNFTFTEKLAYVPVYVEFNPNEIPKEAAVYVNGVCKGAAVVGGSSVEIPAYILEDIGSEPELELRVYYDTKATYNPSPRYQIWNTNTEKFDECSLSLSERKPYYMLKMDGASLSETPSPKLYMANYPNPFNPETTIRYSLPQDANISLDIYNVKGQKVRNLFGGAKTLGDHSCVWDAKDDNGAGVACGMYFAVLNYNGKQISHKLMLMK